MLCQFKSNNHFTQPLINQMIIYTIILLQEKIEIMKNSQTVYIQLLKNKDNNKNVLKRINKEKFIAVPIEWENRQLVSK